MNLFTIDFSQKNRIIEILDGLVKGHPVKKELC